MSGNNLAYQQIQFGINMRQLIYTLVFLLSFSGRSSADETISSLIDYLDCPCSSTFDNPLKGLKQFTVLLPNHPSEVSDLFVRELEKIGNVKKFSFTNPNGINFEGMGTGARLTLITTELNVLGKNDANIIRVSLLLGASVEVLRSKTHLHDTYIWASNQFVTQNQVNKAISEVFKRFSIYYQAANPQEKPFFYVYQ